MSPKTTIRSEDEVLFKTKKTTKTVEKNTLEPNIIKKQVVGPPQEPQGRRRCTIREHRRQLTIMQDIVAQKNAYALQQAFENRLLKEENAKLLRMHDFARADQRPDWKSYGFGAIFGGLVTIFIGLMFL